MLGVGSFFLRSEFTYLEYNWATEEFEDVSWFTTTQFSDRFTTPGPYRSLREFSSSDIDLGGVELTLFGEVSRDVNYNIFTQFFFFDADPDNPGGMIPGDAEPESGEDPSTTYRSPLYHVGEPGMAERSYADKSTSPMRYGDFLAGGKLSGASLLSSGEINVSLGTVEDSFWGRVEGGFGSVVSSPGFNRAGTNFDDQISLSTSAAAISVFGFGGSDTLATGSGDDLLDGGEGDDLLRGGTGNDDLLGALGADVFSFFGGDGVDTVLDFDVNDDAIKIENSLLDPSQLPQGVNLSQVGSDTIIEYGVGDSVVLENVALTDWTDAFVPRILGTAGDDTILGTIEADVIVPGAGNDIIRAGSGDDLIIYSPGDDVIASNQHRNFGFDTLDLSAYTADQVSFRTANQHDILIDTPDGTIELDYQIRFDLGHERSNIEAILFSDGSLDEAGIRARAIADQGTAGDDSISGTSFDDVIAGRSGNDILVGLAGADVFEFSAGSGVDVIGDFNPSEDVLRFDGLTLSDLTISQDNNDTLISSGPDDEVRLAGIDQSELSSGVFEFV